MQSRWLICLALASLALASCAARAQDLEPRAYANTPVGMNFLVLGYSHMWGGVTFDPTIPLKDAKLAVESAFLTYARSLEVFGQSGKLDVILPQGLAVRHRHLLGPAQGARDRRVRRSQIPLLDQSLWCSGAEPGGIPELRAGSHRRASVQMSVPGGQYDPNKLVNLGTHRRSFKTELGVSKRWSSVTVGMTGEGVTSTIKLTHSSN
jgi:hypothetical protein